MNVYKLKKKKPLFSIIYSFHFHNLQLLSSFYWWRMNRSVNFAAFFCGHAHWLIKEASDMLRGGVSNTVVKNTPPSKSISLQCQTPNTGVWFISKQNTVGIISVTPSQGLFFPVFLRILSCHTFPSQWQNVDMEQYEVFSTNKYTDPIQHRVINAQGLAAQ